MGPLRNMQHERFCHELANLRTQEDAYKAAGYAPDSGNASVLANRPEVKARVAELQAEISTVLDVRRERLVVDIDRIASANVADLFERVKVKGKWIERFKDLSAMPRGVTATIQSVDFDPKTGRISRIKMHDSLAAMTTLLKYLGGLPEAPQTPTVNIFRELSADDQRALADLVEALAQGKRAEPLGEEVPPATYRRH